MNLRKHVAGFAIFSTIVGSAILINAYLTAPIARVQPVAVNETVPHVNNVSPLAINYKVRMVSLDFINKESYTELKLELQPGQRAPERVWITTVFFAPAYPGKVWMAKAEINAPFAQGNQTETVATAPSDPFTYLNAPRDGYFARVYISTSDAGDSYPPDYFSRDITNAVPVVVHWAYENRKPTGTFRELNY